MKPATLTPAEQAAVRIRIAAGDTARDISESLGIVRKTLLAAVKRYGLGPWLVRGSDRRGPPADFAEMAAKLSNPQLAKHYGCGTCLPERWRKELGLAGGPRLQVGPPRRPMPEGFATYAPGRSVRHLAEHYGMSTALIARFRTEAGLDAGHFGRRAGCVVLAPLVTNAYMAAPLNRPVRDGSRAGMAADYLRKYGAVYRCTPMGAADPKGSHWRRGSAILTDAEIIQRAEYNGFDADAWKRVA